jgi:hypothetical protein
LGKQSTEVLDAPRSLEFENLALREYRLGHAS